MSGWEAVCSTPSLTEDPPAATSLRVYVTGTSVCLSKYGSMHVWINASLVVCVCMRECVCLLYMYVRGEGEGESE